jgi:outer membrane protein TolC
MRERRTLAAKETFAVINAEQAYQQAIVSLVQARADRYADTAALFQALGGGRWNRADVVSTATQDKGWRPSGKQAPE